MKADQQRAACGVGVAHHVTGTAVTWCAREAFDHGNTTEMAILILLEFDLV
jgi:hypothetical protein